jgi:NADPH-dependent glutamate synthase beta subunit-like oxidoreductase
VSRKKKKKYKTDVEVVCFYSSRAVTMGSTVVVAMAEGKERKEKERTKQAETERDRRTEREEEQRSNTGHFAAR